MKMRFIHLTVLVSIAAFASGEEPSNSYLPGRFLFLPSQRQTQETFLNPLSGYRPSEITTASSTTFKSTTEAVKPEGEKEDVSESSGNEQPQQIKNVDSGVYYILLPDGRLQRVEYKTTPLVKEESAKLVQQDSKQTETQSKPASNGSAVPEKNDESFSVESDEVGNDEVGNNGQGSQQGQYTEGNYARFPFQYENAQYSQTSTSAAEFQRQQTYQQPNVNQGVHYIQTVQDQQAFSRVQQPQQVVAPYQTSTSAAEFQRQQTYQQPNVNQDVHYIQTVQDQQAFSRVQQPQQVVAPYQTAYNVNGVQYQIIQNQPAHYVQIQPEQSSQQKAFQNMFSQQSQNQVTYDFQQSEQQAQYPVLQSDNEPSEEDGSEQKQQPETPISFNGFTATVQYTDVEPISAPIYAYNSMPLVRILKK